MVLAATSQVQFHQQPSIASMASAHAQLRAQQRRIPPLVVQWLDQFGEEHYDGFGGICRYFSRRSIRNMQRVLGAEIVRHNKKYLRAYMVEGSDNGRVVTMGWRINHLKRR